MDMWDGTWNSSHRLFYSIDTKEGEGEFMYIHSIE